MLLTQVRDLDQASDHTLTVPSALTGLGVRALSRKTSLCTSAMHGPVPVWSCVSGLQLKSAIIAELQLDGGFGDFLMECNEVPFGSKISIASHPFVLIHPSLVIKRRTSEAKRVGLT